MWGSGEGAQVGGRPTPEASSCGLGSLGPAGQRAVERSLTVWCRSGMPILKTIMLKWASSGTDMERPWRPRVEARLPGAPLPWPRVPRGPLLGPSGELSDSEPPSGHSLALWRSSSSLDAGLWVIVGPRGDRGQQHHRRLPGGAKGGCQMESPGLFRGHRQVMDKLSRAATPRAPGSQEGGWTHPQILLPSLLTHAHPCHASNASPSLPLALLTAPHPSCAPLCR